MGAGLRSTASKQCGATNTWSGVVRKMRMNTDRCIRAGYTAPPGPHAITMDIPKGWVRPRRARDGTASKAKRRESGSSKASRQVPSSTRQAMERID